MFKVRLPKILFLALDIGSFYRNNIFNTNDLAELSNQYKSELVRLRVDKKDYKYLDDTRRGGLRGNFSTLLTWRGLVKRGSSIVNSYSLGRDGRLVNAICEGKIVLNRQELTAYTNEKKLAELLETEAWLLTVRETQAHVKALLQKNGSLSLKRDNINFPKDSVFISENNQYFIRSLVNNFKDSAGKTLQFRLINLWDGSKFKKKNIHPLLVLPAKDDPWAEIYAVKNEEIYEAKPMLLDVDLEKKTCKDEKGKAYQMYPLSAALKEFSTAEENIQNRLNYQWEELKEKYCEEEVDYNVRKEDEFSNFLRLFLGWRRKFDIDGKEVVDIKVISSGGPDVELIFSGGTKQKLELEHEWGSYLAHRHHTNNAFKNVWVFSEEPFSLPHILKIFKLEKGKNNDRIPDVFLGFDTEGKKRAYRINWEKETHEELPLNFED